MVVRIVKPEKRTVDYAIDQPGFVDAFEQTSIFAKVSGFIDHFYVDIGQEVKKGELLAEIGSPNWTKIINDKAAQVDFNKSLLKQSEQLVEVAKSNVESAIAQLNEAKSKRQVSSRSRPMGVRSKTSDPDGEGKCCGQASARRDTKTTRFQHSLAKTPPKPRWPRERPIGRPAKSIWEKAKIDVKTQEAKVRVAEADERKAAAMLAYTKVTAP